MLNLKSLYLIPCLLVITSCLKSDPSPLIFNQGITSLPPDSVSSQYLSANSCKECHYKQYSEWENSMHKKSYSNRLFISAIKKENQTWCINCHTPLNEQSKHFTETDTGHVIPNYKNSDLLDEGINCSVCHVRGDMIYTSSFPGISARFNSPHKLSYDPYLKSPEFCAGCHEFSFPEQIKPITLSNSPMQSTYTEWKKSGEKRTCQNCHFSHGNHTLPGPHTKGFIKSNLDLDFRIINTPMETFAVIINFSFDKIGHNFMTGDLFRSESINIFDNEKNALRTYSLNRNVNLITKKITSDTILKNRNSDGKLKEEVRIQVGQSFPSYFKIIYHYQGHIESTLEKENFPKKELNFVIYDGNCGKLESIKGKKTKSHL